MNWFNLVKEQDSLDPKKMDEALEEIQKFVEYIRDQQKVLAKIENETNTYKQFFQ